MSSLRPVRRRLCLLAPLLAALLLGVSPVDAVPFGTPAFRVADARAGSADSDPDEFARVVGTPRMLFAATDEGGRELWVSNGTAAGTKRLADINPGSADSDPAELTSFAGKVYFAATGAGGRELWVSNGTVSGTKRVKDLEPARGVGSDPGNLLVAAGKLWFTATTLAAGRELWSSTGTAAGTAMVIDLNAGPESADPDNLVILGSRLLFAATDDTRGRELWSASLATGAVRLVYDLGTGESWPDELVRAGSSVFFSADDSLGRRGLYFTDGTGTAPVSDPDLGEDPRPRNLAALGQSVFFAATTAHGEEPWISDGTALNTHEIADIFPGSDGSQPRGALAHDGRVYFVADSYTEQSGAWVSDGSAEGTSLMWAKDPTDHESRAGEFSVHRGRLYFVADDATGTSRLYVGDGTTAGTQLAAGAGAMTDPGGLHTVGTSLVFAASTVTAGREPYALATVTAQAVVRPEKKYTAQASRARNLKVAVKVLGRAKLGGTVVMTGGGRTLGKAKVVDGVAVVKINRRLAVGKHVVRATYLGTWDASRAVSAKAVLRIVR